jgi:hypothetical protein
MFSTWWEYMVGAASASSDVIIHAAPSDYDELTRLYSPELRRFVRNQLGYQASAEDVDDALQYILMQFIATRVIDQYNPEHVSEFNGRAVSFKAFLKAKAALYCRGWREKLGKLGTRELQIVDSPVGDGTNRWIDNFGEWDHYTELDDATVYERLREYLAARPPGPGELSLVELLDGLAERVADGQPIGTEAVRKQFGLSRAMTGTYMQRLRAELKEAARRDTFEVGGLVLSAPQVRSAVDALVSYPGHHVLPAFKAAGHPLQHAGKTWYLKPARAEILAYPELKQAPGGHYRGGHGNAIKVGLVHWLERLLGGPVEGQASSVPPGPSAWRVVDSALRRLPGSTPEGVEFILELARQVFAEAA